MRGEVCQLSTKELAFALAESEQFLNVDKQLGLSGQLVEALAARTEGWVSGLPLASLALEDATDSQAFVEEFSGSDRDVTDYLGEAVLNQQRGEIRRFLLWTSLLQRMNAELNEAKKEILKLRAELRRTEEERDILKKAAGYFANHQE